MNARLKAESARMPQPVALTDEERDALNRLAAPIAWGQRQQFLDQVTAALADHPQVGPGVIFRVARELQRGFTTQAQRETVHRDEPRHLRPFRAGPPVKLI